MPTKPTSYLDWVPSGNPLYITDPPTAEKAVGWSPNERPFPTYMNWLFYTTDQWIQYLDQAVNEDVSELNLDQTTRLINGGYWSWDLSTATLAWDDDFQVAIPSIPDANNDAAAGSVVLADGQVAYVSANIPFTTQGDTQNLSNEITGIAYFSGIVIGQTVTGSGIPTSTTVSSIDEPNDKIAISNNATATASAVNLTFSGVGALNVSVANSEDLLPSPNTIVLARRVGDRVYVGVNAFYMPLQDRESKRLSLQGFALTFEATAGENLSQRDAVYVSDGTGVDSGRTAGRLYKCDVGVTNGSRRSGFTGFVATTVLSGATATVVAHGLLGGFTSLSEGDTYYVDPTTPGAITGTKPNTSGQYLAPVGLAVSATQVLINAALSSGVTLISGQVSRGIGENGEQTISANHTLDSATEDGTIFLCDTSGGAFNFTLDSPVNNTKFTIKDKTGSFATNPVTIVRFGAEQLEGLASSFICDADWGSWTFVCDGTNYYLAV